MKAYLTSIGESTEQVCKWQLERLGFEVVLLNEKEDWATKYKRFIDIANEDCLRIDADIVLFNDFNILDINPNQTLMVQWQVVDFYSFKIHTGQPIYYSKRFLELVRRVKPQIDNERPETSLWRNKELNKYTNTIDEVVGLHGFWQKKEDMERAKFNKLSRGYHYDNKLIERIYEFIY